MDPSGIVLLLGAILCFLLALQWGGSAKAWGSADVIGTLVGFGLLLIAFTINELWLQEKAMIPPRLLKGQTILFSCLFTFFFSGSFYLLLYYLPTYFQSVKGASASDSGVRTLPLVLGDGLFATLSGAALGMIGYYMPLLTLGGVLTTVASGLLYTLDLHSGSNEWIGYQAMAGIGVGLAIQVPMMASQAVVGVEDLSTVSAMILFFQCMGGAIFVQAGQAAFTNKLVQEVLRHLPNVSAARVTSTGATELQSEFHGHELQVILEAYVAGLQDAFIVAIVLAGIATLLSLGSGWRSVKSKKEEPKAQP
jgi:acid phosphatase family membrane protein YuiD